MTYAINVTAHIGDYVEFSPKDIVSSAIMNVYEFNGNAKNLLETYANMYRLLFQQIIFTQCRQKQCICETNHIREYGTNRGCSECNTIRLSNYPDCFGCIIVCKGNKNTRTRNVQLQLSTCFWKTIGVRFARSNYEIIFSLGEQFTWASPNYPGTPCLGTTCKVHITTPSNSVYIKAEILNMDAFMSSSPAVLVADEGRSLDNYFM
jgi:hypothetical protein